MTPKKISIWSDYNTYPMNKFHNMSSWLEEKSSLREKLNVHHGEVHLELLSEEKIYISDEQANLVNAHGKLRKIFLSSNKKLVYAESFLSDEICNSYPPLSNLGLSALGEHIFNQDFFTRKQMFIANFEYKQEIFFGRKCIYSQGDNFLPVTEVFLFHE